MPRRRAEEERGLRDRAMALHKRGVAWEQIAERLEINRRYVWRYVREPKERGRRLRDEGDLGRNYQFRDVEGCAALLEALKTESGGSP